MNLGIAGKVAIVTGAGRGIGAACAATLAAEGAHVLLLGRTEADLAAVAAAIAAAGGLATAVPLDLCEDQQVTEAFATFAARGWIPEILVNNANENLTGYVEFTDIPMARWLWVFERNMTALAQITQRTLPAMRERRWGRVITIGSMAGVLGGAKQVPYATLKAGLEGFSRSLALEVSPEGVTVNLVHPGLVDTPRTAGQITPRARKWIALKTATRKLSTPEDVAHMVAFLASDLAGNLTGGSFHVAGGVELGFSL